MTIAIVDMEMVAIGEENGNVGIEIDGGRHGCDTIWVIGGGL